MYNKLDNTLDHNKCPKIQNEAKRKEMEIGMACLKLITEQSIGPSQHAIKLRIRLQQHHRSERT